MNKKERDIRIGLMRILRELRKEKNIAQQVLADYSTISRGTISDMENFKTIPFDKTLLKLVYTFLSYSMPTIRPKISKPKFSEGRKKKAPRKLVPLD